jgi:hypothetical protein
MQALSFLSRGWGNSDMSIKIADDLPYYVYTWAYPDGVVFYVGMGYGNRAEQTGQHHRNYLAYRIRQEIENKGDQIQIVIIARFKVRQHAHVFEKMLISTYGIENLANKKSEDGITTQKLLKPHIFSTVQFAVKSPKKLIDQITLIRITKQPWQDDGASI